MGGLSVHDDPLCASRFLRIPQTRLPANPLVSYRLKQHVALLAERELDDAFGREIAPCEQHLFVCYRDIVDLEAAGLDLPLRLPIRGDQARSIECNKYTQARTLERSKKIAV